MNTTTARLVERLTEAVNDLSEWPIPEEDAVDVIGHLKAAVAKLDTPQKRSASYPGLRQRLENELDPNATGQDFYVDESRSAQRSYNTQALLRDLGELTDPPNDPGDVLRWLLIDGAATLEWHWKKLQAVADRYNLSLTTAKHEIEDGDPEHHIGEVWTTRYSVKAWPPVEVRT